MSKWLSLACIIFGLQATEAQVKDTLRENIDYRRQYSFPASRGKPDVQFNLSNQVEARSTVPDRVSKTSDTLREGINYRRNISFYRSYKFKRGSLINHYLGIQANSVFHELSQPDSAYVENPYTLTYSINHKLKGYGFGIGYGYTEWGHEFMNSSNHEVASINSRLNFRFGLEKKSTLGKRFLVGFGLDIVHAQNKSIKKTFISGFVDEVNGKTIAWGFGPRASILFKVRKWIFIGTETSYYFKKSKSHSYTKFTGLPPENESKSSDTSFTFLAPLTVIVIVRI